MALAAAVAVARIYADPAARAGRVCGKHVAPSAKRGAVMTPATFGPAHAGRSRVCNAANTVVLAGITVLCAACGGNHDAGPDRAPVSQPPASSPPPTPPPTPAGNAPVGGAWVGTAALLGNGSQPIVGIVDEDGRAYFLQDDGLMFFGKITSSGSQVTATLNVAPARGTATSLWDGSPRGTVAVDGTVQARSSMSVEHVITSANGGRMTGTMALNNVMSHGVDSSLDFIAGNYVVARGEVGGVLNISSQGEMFLQDPASGCVVNGEMAIMNSNYNVYDVRMLFSNCTGSYSTLNGVTLGGLAEAIFDDTFARADGVLALVSGFVEDTPTQGRFVFFRQ